MVNEDVWQDLGTCVWLELSTHFAHNVLCTSGSDWKPEVLCAEQDDDDRSSILTSWEQQSMLVL